MSKLLAAIIAAALAAVSLNVSAAAHMGAAPATPATAATPATPDAAADAPKSDMAKPAKHHAKKHHAKKHHKAMKKDAAPMEDKKDDMMKK